MAVATLLLVGFGCASTPEAPVEDTSWKFHTIVDTAFVQQYAKVPVPADTMRKTSNTAIFFMIYPSIYRIKIFFNVHSPFWGQQSIHGLTLLPRQKEAGAQSN